jgi:hypothetical protein
MKHRHADDDDRRNQREAIRHDGEDPRAMSALQGRPAHQVLSGQPLRWAAVEEFPSTSLRAASEPKCWRIFSAWLSIWCLGPLVKPPFYALQLQRMGGTAIAAAGVLADQLAPMWEAMSRPLLPRLAKSLAEKLEVEIEKGEQMPVEQQIDSQPDDPSMIG